jgi:uncharacterized protein YjbI with pentapeptide repeats
MGMAGLGDRWRTPVGQALAEEAVARLVAGRGLDGLGLGWHDGRVDLRGLPAPIPSRLRRFESRGWFVEVLGNLITFRGARLLGLDLSGAQLQSLRFFGCQITDCRLDGANCQDWRLWDTEVADCGFSRASLRDAVVGTWHEGRRNAWRRVDFTRTDFRVVEPLEAVFEDCDFSGAKIVGVDFSQCAFARCRFAGSLNRVLFDGRELPGRPAPPPMSKVDFAAAVFRDVEFRGFGLEDVTLPPEPDVRLYRRARCVARRGIQLLEGDGSKPAQMLRAVLQDCLRGPGADQDALVFVRRDYLDGGGADLVALAEDVLGRAQAECLR